MKEEGMIPKRQVRADALRNEDAILLAAKEVFAENGVDAPVRTIAARAAAMRQKQDLPSEALPPAPFWSLENVYNAATNGPEPQPQETR